MGYTFGFITVASNHTWLVVFGKNPSEKYDFVNWDDEIPKIWENNGIFTYIGVIFGANVGKYSSTMEHLGYRSLRVESTHGMGFSDPTMELETRRESDGE